MISVGIIGGSGYTGNKIIQFCNSHLHIEDFTVYANNSAGKYLYHLFPEQSGIIENKKIEGTESLLFNHDVYFLALPHGESLKYIPEILANGKNVIDLGSDLRLDSVEDYKKWYQFDHKFPELLETKSYGLADYYQNYSHQNLVANPGCYPTASLLSILPLVKYFNEKILSISINAYSGTSGAGKSVNSRLMMSEMCDNTRAYNVNSHRHEGEILQELKKSGFDSPFSFITHLLPLAVGIYSTTAIHLTSNINHEEVLNAFQEIYKKSIFVRLRNEPPELKWVVGTNFIDINISTRGNLIIITAAIDNLIKGAAGQAMQNLNKIYSWEESEGIINRRRLNVSVY